MLDHLMNRTGVSLSAFARQVFDDPDGAGMNACVACCDRWAADGRVGLTVFGRDGVPAGRTFQAMRDDAARFANLLTARGVGPGDVVAGMLPIGAELLTVILGTWRAGAVFQPIATGFGPAAIEARSGFTAAKLIVTDGANRDSLDHLAYCPPILMVTDCAEVQPGDGAFMTELMRQSTWFTPVRRAAEDPFLLLADAVMPELRSLLSVLTGIRVGLEPKEAAIGLGSADTRELYVGIIGPLLTGGAAIAFDMDLSAPCCEMPAAPRRAAALRRSDRASSRAEPTLLAA